MPDPGGGYTLIQIFAVGLTVILYFAIRMHMRAIRRSDDERFKAPTQAELYEPWDNAPGDYPAVPSIPSIHSKGKSRG